MNILSLPAILSLTINFSVALMVLMDRPKAIAHRLFFAFILAFAFWNLGEILMINSATLSMARLGAHLISLGFFLTPALFLLITFYFPRQSEVRWPLMALIPAVPLLLLLASLPEPMMVILRVPALENLYFHALPSSRAWAFDILVLVSGLYLGWGVGNLLLSSRKARSRRERSQALLLIAGFLTIELLAAAINVLRTFLLPQRSFFFLSTGLSIVISGFFAVAILRYRLVNLQRMLRRGLVYTVLSAIVLSVYYLLIRHAAAALSAGFGIHSAFLEALLIFLLVILIRPLEDNVHRLMERVLFSQRQQLRRQIRDFSRSLLQYTDFGSFLSRVEEFLRSMAGTSLVGIFVQEADTNQILLRSDGRNARVEFPVESPVLRRIAESDGPIEIAELELEAPNDGVVTALSKMGYCQVLPLRFDGSLLGMLALGPKTDGADYTVDELELFGLLANEVGIALSRNLALEESRAKEARLRQAEKLAAMGKLVAGVAHEIRNPLNVISSSAQTLKKKRLSEEERQKLLQFVIDETEHLNELLSDFLRLARPRQPLPKRGKVDDLLQSVAQAVRPRAEANGVEIVTPHVEAEVATDFQILEQVLLNLAINAVEAMPSGGRLTLRANLSVAGWLVLQVSDSGPGIPREVQGRILEPFFTTKDDGTGLGLSIAYTLVETLGGRLDFRTGPEGTTFTVEVPVER
jgi:signal transduction histidine kinase